MTAPSKRDFGQLDQDEKWECMDKYVRTLNEAMARYHATYMAWLLRESRLYHPKDWPKRGDRTYPEWLKEGYRVWREMDLLDPPPRHRSIRPGKGGRRFGSPAAGGSVPPPPPPPPPWPE